MHCLGLQGWRLSLGSQVLPLPPGPGPQVDLLMVATRPGRRPALPSLSTAGEAVPGAPSAHLRALTAGEGLGWIAPLQDSFGLLLAVWSAWEPRLFRGYLKLPSLPGRSPCSTCSPPPKPPGRPQLGQLFKAV